MGKKYTIGLIYTVDENWIAGTYYIENLVSALKTLPEPDQPILKIYCHTPQDYKTLIDKTGYENSKPVLLKEVTTLQGRLINKISSTFFGTHWVTGGTDDDVDLIFPNPSSYHFTRIKNKLFWIPDFQEKHYPDFFSKAQIESRVNIYLGLVKDKSPIVFSSNDARNDFIQLYPRAGNPLFVMPFAVANTDLGAVRMSNLIVKYNLPERYFICSNQFWAHKNHKIVLLALKFLKESGHPTTVVFTGKPYDNRNPHYYDSLMNFVAQYELQDYVKFLGFIPRDEQLVLMKNSLAVIQPSLFEGWSTVVEDAKALNKHIFASDIPVHREQLPGSLFFFSIDDYQRLASYMMGVKTGESEFVVNYNENIKAFGCIFIEIVATLVK